MITGIASNVAAAVVTGTLTKLETPTTKDSGSAGWCIINSELGCGARILQGWSSGIGISNNESEFEKKLFTLMYLSLHPQHCSNKWDMNNLGGVSVPIGVARYRHQFLKPRATYILSSKTPWIDRFEKFVKTHDLGQFSVSHEWLNIFWGGNMNKYATWTWNGKIPTAAAVGITDWKLPE